MTLQSSGAISLGNLQTEFGGSNPISLSEYYGAGGAPGSGVLKLSDFYGRSSADVTPNAVNWANVNGTGLILTTSNLTINGINTTITLRITNSVFAIDSFPTCSYRINSGTYVDMSQDGSVDISISNGDTLQFRGTRGGFIPSGGIVMNVTIQNVSDGLATLDTFAFIWPDA